MVAVIAVGILLTFCGCGVPLSTDDGLPDFGIAAQQARQQEEARRAELARVAGMQQAAKNYRESHARLRKVGNLWCVIPESRLPIAPADEVEAFRKQPLRKSDCFASQRTAENVLRKQQKAEQAAARAANEKRARRSQQYDVCMEGMRLAYELGNVNAYDAYHSCDPYR